MKRTSYNSMRLEFPAKSVNEGFARSAVAAFAAQCDPSVGAIADLKTAVSEAVTNAIVHAYKGIENKERCPVYIQCRLTSDKRITVKIRDKGQGIADIKQAMEPLYTTDPEGERSGMGFTIMQSFCDRLRVSSKKGKGTSVILEKSL